MRFGKKVFSLLAAAAISGTMFSTALAAELPEVKVLATGGTIAGVAPSDTQVTNYKSGCLTVDTLLNAVPAINDIAVVTGEQISNIGSENMSDKVWLKLAERCNALLADPKVKGIVITHGTDTMEETSYFLNLTVKSDKPVVLVGSMRPSTGISADGPMNLLNAVKLAADPDAAGRGVLVAMNDKIDAARDVTKSNTSNLATFTSPDFGCLGYFVGGEPHFYRQVIRKNTKDTEFDVSGMKSLPRVDIIYTHGNDSRELIDAAVKAGAKGIIYAGSGMGSIHEEAEKGLVDAQKAGVVVVRASRTGSGMVIASWDHWTDLHFLDGDTLNPQKSRILLQLALTKTNDLAEIQRMYDEY